MEQTSSSAYPNILAVDYVKKARVASSAKFLMTAEQYLNVGYQKLLTFERPGGGFDWWGNGEPLVWLSAYGLQEFNDMSRVYPIDRGVIEIGRASCRERVEISVVAAGLKEEDRQIQRCSCGDVTDSSSLIKID